MPEVGIANHDAYFYSVLLATGLGTENPVLFW